MDSFKVANVPPNHQYPHPCSHNKGGWKSAIFIIFMEVAERFAYYGVSGNLIMYLTNVVGQPTALAAKNVNIWHGTSAIFPLLGAFLADSYLGRFKTILLSSVIYLLGLVLLTVSASAMPSENGEAMFFAALYIVTVGEGGHKPCVQTFAADQFDEGLPEERRAKSSFFNWWYMGIVFGATAATLVVIYVQDYVGWGVGYGMLTAAVVAALAVFLIGCRTYRMQAPVGSPFTRVARVVVAAFRKRSVTKGAGECRGIYYDDGPDIGVGNGSLARTCQFGDHSNEFETCGWHGCLDKAAFIDETDESSKTRNPWRLCTMDQVEEVKLLVRLIPIWLCCLMFTVVIAQQGTYFTKQGTTMLRGLPAGSHRRRRPPFQVPAASLQVITGLTILAAVPVYDRLLVPVARRITGHPSGITMLQRIGAGLILSVITMAVSALVESWRVRVATRHGLLDDPRTAVPMSVWWLVPQYFLCGLSDVFAIVGMQELFYDQMPVAMRSVGAAAYIGSVGVGSFLSSAVITVVQALSSSAGNEWLVDNINRARLDCFYWLLAGLGLVNLFVYVLVAKGFVYNKVAWDDDGVDQEKGLANDYDGFMQKVKVDPSRHS